MESYIVARTDKIGDLVLSLPVAEAIKDSNSAARVTFVVSPVTMDLARACPFIDDVIPYEESGTSPHRITRLAREMRKRKPGVGICLRPTFRVALAMVLAGISTRAGTAYRYYSALFNRPVREHRRFAERHELEYNLGILAAVLKIKDRPYLPRIVVPEASKLYARKALAERGLVEKGFVIVHPGSAKSARNLPLAAYARVADAIEADLRVRVLVTAGKDQADIVAEMDSHRKTKSLALVGAPTLLDLVGVIGAARLFISGSTGPMHLASAVGTPTLSFFSPVRSCSPRRWQPTGSHTRIIMPPVAECPTCIGRRCEYYDCMQRIDPNEVILAVKSSLKISA